MARQSNKLTARSVANIRKTGFHSDGGGLYLQVTANGGRSWVFRFQKQGRARWMGLGPAKVISLQEARERALEARKLLLDGKDPIDTRRATVQAEAGVVTFKEESERYIDSHKAGWKNKKHAAQWSATLRTYVYGTFGDISVAMVDTGMVLKALEPIWTAKPETASRVRGRIEAILDWATARGYRTGDNPARWRGHLQSLLPKTERLKQVRHHPSLPYVEIGSFVAELRTQDGTGARALEFAILTGARTGEVIGATRSEIDLRSKVWIIPAERMKGGREHRVPLSDQAVEIITAMTGASENDGFIFPGGRAGRPLSNMALLAVLKRMKRKDLTVHGFRSTFRDWAAERTAYPREVCEMALAHAIGDKVEAAYRRGDLFEKRKRLMANWAEFCDRPDLGDVVTSLAAKRLAS